MKKIFYLLFTGIVIFTACKDNELPEANFDLAQVNTFTATAGDAQVALAWTPADGFTPVEYYLSWVSSTTGVEGGEKTLAANTTAATIDGLVNDVSYTFSIQPCYEKGRAGKVSATAKPMNERFPVTNFTARAGNALVRLAWTKPASERLLGYKITVTSGGQVVDINTPATENYNVTGLTNGQEYTFAITCVYPQGQSEPVTASATPGLIFPIMVSSATFTVNNARIFEYNDMYFGENVQSVSWNFGDGVTSADEAPAHAYAATGSYTVTVTVTYAGGNTETGSIDIVVENYKWGERALDYNGSTGYVKTSNPVFSPDGQIMYVPTSSPSGHLFAVDVEGGTIKWVFSITELTYGGGAMVHPANGTIYQGSDAAIYAINPDGTQKWKVATAGSGAAARVRAFPALSLDGTVAYFLSNSVLYALNVESGAEVWKKQLSDINSGISIGSAVLVGNNGTVYIGTNQGVYAFSSSGNLTWQTATKYNVTESGAMAINGNVLYAALKGTDGLVAINTDDGSQLWTAGASGDAYFPIVDKNGVIYFTEKLAAGKVYAVNPNGSSKWTKTIGESLNYGGLVLDENGVIYGGTQSKANGNYKRYAINTATGDFVFNENSAQQIMAAFTIGPDKRLYWGTIGSGNIGTLYALEINAGLETGSWSVRGGDLQGTNRQK
ncbi:MAG: PQQ-binding-like beta-propeller repeat protein [Prevotellaceae bacterium]|jgi:outer membrane protein assembly factor BamB|nr:PQQ-binding-like beta-propeller repeat protein [Prevotellaceae bacterium]